MRSRQLAVTCIGWIVIAALTGCGAQIVTPDVGDTGAEAATANTADATAR